MPRQTLLDKSNNGKIPRIIGNEYDNESNSRANYPDEEGLSEVSVSDEDISTPDRVVAQFMKIKRSKKVYLCEFYD